MSDVSEGIITPTMCGRAIHSGALATAYLGGAVVLAVGLMSFISIVSRAAFGRPIVGDFELVEIGIAIAGSLFLPYCQAMRGHIAVDLFMINASPRAIYCADRIGDALMALTLLVIGWRAGVAAYGIWLSGETSMLLGFPMWIGYASVVPGTVIAGLIALVQCGFTTHTKPAEPQYEQR